MRLALNFNPYETNCCHGAVWKSHYKKGLYTVICAPFLCFLMTFKGKCRITLNHTRKFYKHPTLSKCSQRECFPITYEVAMCPMLERNPKLRPQHIRKGRVDSAESTLSSSSASILHEGLCFQRIAGFIPSNPGLSSGS